MSGTRSEKALSLHRMGCNCAQSVLGAFAGELGVSEETALRIATGFGGGMGRSSGPCGAVTGACMVVGLRQGMRTPSDAAAKDATYEAVNELVLRFREEHGGVGCTELLGEDLGTPEGRARAKERDLFATRCSSYIRDAVILLEDEPS